MRPPCRLGRSGGVQARATDWAQSATHAPGTAQAPVPAGAPPPPVSAQVERRAARAAACDARAAGDGQPGCAGRVGLGCRTSSGRPLRRNSSEPAARSRSRTSDTASSRKVALAGPVGGQPPAPYCSHRRGQLGRAGARGRGAGAPCLSAGRQAGGPPTVKRGSMRV